jgi:hypothetical protein
MKSNRLLNLDSHASSVVASLVLVLVLQHPAAAQDARATITSKTQTVKEPPALDQTLPAYVQGPSFHFSKTAPINFPVPDYKSRVTQRAFFNTTKGQPTATLTITTQDEPQTVFNFYLNALRSSGWKTVMPTPEALSKMRTPGDLFFLNGTKDRQIISIFCTRDKSNMRGTNLNISWSQNN